MKTYFSILVLLLISVTMFGQKQNIKAHFGIGVDFLLQQQFPGTEKYSQIYLAKDKDWYSYKSVYIDYTTKLSDKKIEIMRIYTHNTAMNIPLFLKIDINKLHIIPTISLPIFNLTSSSLLNKEAFKNIPSEGITTYRGPEGDRGWNYGSFIIYS